MKIALFLGAGASAPYGMPTTKELWDKIKRGNLDFPRRDLLDSDDFPDIEHVLSVLDQLITFADSRAGRLCAEFVAGVSCNECDSPAHQFAKRLKSHIDDSRSSKEIIEQLITEHYKWDLSNNEYAEKILRPLFDLARSREGHVTVFTTNYDTAIEEYCRTSDRHIEQIDGFTFRATGRTLVWDGNFSPQDGFGTKVFLYKLHGSMSWFIDGSGPRASLSQKIHTDESKDQKRGMYIRPSLDTKNEATQKEPYTTILHQFAQTLPSFDMCVVIGYSFRDHHISDEMFKFAKAGKVLAVLSPTAATDFVNNVIDKNLTHTQKIKINEGPPHTITIESCGRRGVVYVINKCLDADDMDGIIDGIRSAIGDDSFDLESGADEEAGWL